MSALGLMGLMTHADTPFRRYAITLAHLNLGCVLFVLWGSLCRFAFEALFCYENFRAPKHDGCI
jgi:hypothetical protein